MKCEQCPALVSYGYEYPETYCYIHISEDKLISYKDGSLGCKLKSKIILKKILEIDFNYENFAMGEC